MNLHRGKFLFGLILLLSPFVSTADESDWSIALDVGLEARAFAESPMWSGQDSKHGQLAVNAQAEIRWRSGSQRAALIPYARWDQVDDERSLIDLREAYWAIESDSAELLVGANTVFWGVTESVHLVDIINQTDFAGDIDGEQKLGQPMVNIALQRDWGLINVFALPYFRERTFPGVAGRFRAPLPVDTDAAVYGSSDGQNHADFALRYSHYFGDVDIGLSAFSGTSREARLLPNDRFTALVPHYDLIDQVGLDLQYTTDAWLWKLETFVRDGYSETFAAAVGGFEYTLYQVRDSAVDIGLLLEYQYDGRGELEPISIADNDLFVGIRLAMNDVQDTAILAGVVRDTETGEMLINIEAERRIGNSYLLELRARGFSGADRDDLSYSFARDDYLQLQLTMFF
jgi:hypothetical protein